MYIKLLRSELYRTVRQKNPYILLIIGAVITFLTCFVLLKLDFLAPLGIDSETYMAIASEGNSMEGMENAAQLGAIIGQNTTVDANTSLIGEGVFYSADINKLFNIVIAELDNLLLMAIFVGIFIGDVYSMGIDKNLVISNNKRGILFAARATVIAIYSLVLHAFTWIVTAICAGTMGKGFDFNWSGKVVVYLIVSYLLVVVFGLMEYAFVVLTRSKAAGITIGVILSTGALAAAISVVNWLIIRKLNIDSDFTISNYMVTENLVTFNSNYTSGELTRVLCVCAVYAALSIILTFVLNKKRDIA